MLEMEKKMCKNNDEVGSYFGSLVTITKWPSSLLKLFYLPPFPWLSELWMSPVWKGQNAPSATSFPLREVSPLPVWTAPFLVWSSLNVQHSSDRTCTTWSSMWASFPHWTVKFSWLEAISYHLYTVHLFPLLFSPLKHLSSTYYALGTVSGFPGMTKTLPSLRNVTDRGQTRQMCISYCCDIVR